MGRLTAIRPVLTKLWSARREIATFLRTGDEEVGYHLRRRFGLTACDGLVHTVPPDLFAARAVPRTSEDATIIIPVFNAADHVARLLDHLPDTIPEGQTVLVIDDGSDDPGITPILTRFGSKVPTATVMRMPRNQGFVAAANAGLAQLPAHHHAIILNSDTLPPADWVPRLLAPIEQSPDTASVCPLSNAAEILSIPRPGTESVLTRSLVDDLDHVARTLRPRRIGLPTGVGFCMAMNRRFIDQIGGFDPGFGRGYGEEVDWCLRAKAAGGENVVATNLFVGHAGGASFGLAARKTGVAQGTRKIAQSHPSFQDDARAWENRDPIGPERLALSLAWAAHVAQGPVSIIFAHALGGGAETALLQEMATHFRDSPDPLVILRAGGPSLWRVELHGPRLSVKGDVDTRSLLHDLLEPLQKRRVVYSCAVGTEDPGAVAGTLLKVSAGQRLELRLHDFFAISPSWNLIGSDGHYQGVPELESADPAHGLSKRADRPGLSHRAWRAQWGDVIETADEITAFAASGAALIETAYPSAKGKVRIRPHALPDLPPRLSRGGTSIGVLGGINLPKGAKVLEDLARVTTRRITVIGALDGRFRLSSPHMVHGSYDRADIAKLARRYDVGLWLVPSICPETFSFATHEALATGLPVLAFDLGAQGEAVRHAPNGHAIAARPEDVATLSQAIERMFASKP